jgi:hypothetical protein
MLFCAGLGGVALDIRDVPRWGEVGSLERGLWAVGEMNEGCRFLWTFVVIFPGGKCHASINSVTNRFTQSSSLFFRDSPRFVIVYLAHVSNQSRADNRHSSPSDPCAATRFFYRVANFPPPAAINVHATHPQQPPPQPQPQPRSTTNSRHNADNNNTPRHSPVPCAALDRRTKQPLRLGRRHRDGRRRPVLGHRDARRDGHVESAVDAGSRHVSGRG